MKITVKAKDIEITMCDDNNNSMVKYKDQNDEIIRTIKAMTSECINILKQSNL